MLKNIDIANIRGIAEGSLDDLASINVFVGPNNSGKSTVLEALFIGCNPSPKEAFNRTLKTRKVENPGEWFLYRGQGLPGKSGAIKVKSHNGLDRHVSLKLPQGNRKDIALTWTDKKEQKLKQDQAKQKERFSTEKDRNKKDDAKKQLEELNKEIKDWQNERVDQWPFSEVNFFEPEERESTKSLHSLYTIASQRGVIKQAKSVITEVARDIEDVEILAPGNRPVLHFVDRTNRALPVSLAGEGIQLLLRISLELATPAGGLVMLEEPETHLHPAAIRQVARIIHATARRNIQVALSTHNLDMIDYLLAENDENKPNSLAFYRLQLDDGKLLTSRLTGEEAQESRLDFSEDLR